MQQSLTSAHNQNSNSNSPSNLKNTKGKIPTQINVILPENIGTHSQLQQEAANTGFISHHNQSNSRLPSPKQFVKSAVQTKKMVRVSQSEPKLRTIKEEILRIPKVKQILNKDKFVYMQDIEKRLELVGDVKNEKYLPKQIYSLNDLQKPVQKGKKKRRHKTNYKIPLTKKNISSLNNLITEHISQNQKFKNEEFFFLSDNDYKQPFDLRKLEFMDQINPLKKRYKQKFPDLKEKNLSKNKLLLEHVILNRNVKREIKLQQKKQQKQSSKLNYNNGETLIRVKQNAKKMTVNDLSYHQGKKNIRVPSSQSIKGIKYEKGKIL